MSIDAVASLAENGGVVAELADLLLGRSCELCRRPGPHVCSGCAMNIAAGCLPTQVPDLSVPTWAASDYRGQVRTLLVAWKESLRPDLTGVLSMLLASAVASAVGSGPVALVPVPVTRRSLNRRGRDVLADLTWRAARRLTAIGLPSQCRSAVGFVRQPDDQVGLELIERRTNVKDAMRADASALRAAERVVVVDDIVTSGATLTEVVRALTRAGVAVEAAAVVASAGHGRSS
jgi:predicted amidophosphoribosyltransferase